MVTSMLSLKATSETALTAFDRLLCLAGPSGIDHAQQAY